MTRRPTTSWLATCVAALLASTAAGSARADDGVPWQQLSPEQQQTLQQFKEQWDQLPADRQRQLVEGAERWKSLSPVEREQTKERLQRWQSLEPEDRERMR